MIPLNGRSVAPTTLRTYTLGSRSSHITGFSLRTGRHGWRRRRHRLSGGSVGRMHRIGTVFFAPHVRFVARADDHIHGQRRKHDEAHHNLPPIKLLRWFCQSRGLLHPWRGPELDAGDAVHAAWPGSWRSHQPLGAGLQAPLMEHRAHPSRGGPCGPKHQQRSVVGVDVNVLGFLDEQATNHYGDRSDDDGVPQAVVHVAGLGHDGKGRCGQQAAEPAVTDVIRQ